MSETIKKSLGEGHGKGELYAALAHDTGDKFGGMEIKSICMNFSSYEDEDGRVCFANRDMYIAPWEDDELDIVADEGIWIMSNNIYLVGDVHYFGTEHETSTAEFDVLLTNPATSANAVHALINAGVSWTNGATSGNLVAVRGMVAVSGVGNDIVSATGVWAGLDFADAIGAGTGLTCAINAEVQSDNASKPNAIIYIQSLPKTGANFNSVPYIAFTENEGDGDIGSNVLFSLGHAPAGSGRNVTSGTSGDLLYNDTIRIIANGTAKYIPLSSEPGTFTYAYLVALTNVQTIGVTLTSSLVSALAITTTSTDASGSPTVILPLFVDATMSGDGGLGRAIEGKLTVTGKLGDYGNAIKGYTVLTGGTGCAGLVSAICAEMKMPATTALGTHAVLEIELETPQNAVIQQGIGANCTSFIRARVSGYGTAVQSFNDYGYFFDLQGLTSAGNDLWDGCTLKCAIGSTKYYLMLSTATASFTTNYPIVSTYTTGSAFQCGIYGAIVDTATDGIKMISVEANYTANSGIWRGLTIVGHATAATGTEILEGIMGYAGLDADKTLTDGRLTGICGRVRVSGTLSGGGIMVSGITAQINDGGTYTNASHVACLWADWQHTQADSGGNTEILYLTHNAAGHTLDSFIYIYGFNTTNYFMKFYDNSGDGAWRDSTVSGAGDQSAGRLKIRIQGADRYLYYYA